MDKVSFFLLCGGLALLASLITWAFDRPLRSTLESKPQKPMPPAVEPQL
jgi:hypothetical protein